MALGISLIATTAKIPICVIISFKLFPIAKNTANTSKIPHIHTVSINSRGIFCMEFCFFWMVLSLSALFSYCSTK